MRLTGGHSACIFQRLQSRIRSQLVNDVLYYGRLVVMLQKFNTPMYNYNNNVATTCTEDNGQSRALMPATPNPTPTFIRHGLALNGPEEESIPAGQSRIVVFDLPGCAVTKPHFLLYLQQFPLELTLERQSDGKKRLRARPAHESRW